MPGHPNLYSFPTTTDLAPHLRKYILDAQNDALARHTTFRLAVSGGSLPATLSAALLAPAKSESDTPKFSQWEIFYADERCVPLTHEDSNHRLVRSELIEKIPEEWGKPPKVHTIDDSDLDDVQGVADHYEQLLVSSFASRDSVKLPLFDLILLGCGPDGHTCSLFPDHALLRETSAWVLPISDSPKPPPKRITLSLPVVCHAAKVGFVATGKGKREVLKKIFESEEGRVLPCGLVNEGAGEKCSWFCDGEAVEGVNFPRRGSVI